MAMSCKALHVASLATLIVLAGCETVHDNGSTDPGFGEAARYNAAIQTIDPDPVEVAGAAVPGDSGALGVAAVKRYRTGTVRAVEKIQTTGGTSGPSGPKR